MKKLILLLFMFSPSYLYAVTIEDCSSEYANYQDEQLVGDQNISRQWDAHLNTVLRDLNQGSVSRDDALNLSDAIKNGQEVLLNEATDPQEIAFRKLYLCMSKERVHEILSSASASESTNEQTASDENILNEENGTGCAEAQKYEDKIGHWMNTKLSVDPAGALYSLSVTAGGLSVIIDKYETICPQSTRLNDLRKAYKTAWEGCAQLTSGSNKCTPTIPD